MDLSETKNLAVTHEPAKLDEASKLLLDAAAMIEQYGWCQNNYRSRDGQLCILGAAKRVLGITDDQDRAVLREAMNRISKTIGHKVAWQWNDAPGRTKEEVVAKLRAVALSFPG